MANILRHGFVSGKANGADPTQVQPSHWNDGHAFTGGAAGNVLVRDPADAIYGAKWDPLGVWQDVPFNAANFSAPGGGWTVVASSVARNSYVVIGKVVFLQFYLTNTTIVGAPAALNITLPFAVQTAQGGVYGCSIGSFTGLLLQQTAGATLTLYRDIFGTPFTAGNFHGPIGSFVLQLA